MLSAIGWPKVNALFSLFVLILNVIGSYYMIHQYGIKGAALVTSALFWISGLFSFFAFLYFLKSAE